MESESGFNQMLIIGSIPGIIGIILLMSGGIMPKTTDKDRETSTNLQITGAAFIIPYLIVLILFAVIIIFYIISPGKVLTIIKTKIGLSKVNMVSQVPASPASPPVQSL